MTVIAVNPMRCRVWKLHTRLEEHINEDSCRAEIRSLETHGQVVPALGRRVSAHDYDVEIICGARRLFAARHLNKPLLVELKEFTDLQGIAAMEMDNRVRQDISPYERAIAYEGWLRQGYFESRRALCGALGISAARLCRLLRLAALPKALIDAFVHPAEIREAWGVDLCEMSEDPKTRNALLAEAHELHRLDPRCSANETYRRLSSVRRAARTGARRIVRDQGGAELFRIQHNENEVTLQLPLQVLSFRSLQEIAAIMLRAMSDDSDASDTGLTAELVPFPPTH